MPDPTLEVFADVACPFTHVGLRQFVRARRDRQLDLPILVVRAWPLEWINRRPIDPAHLAGEVAALREQVDPEAFAGFDASLTPTTTVPALALTAAAYRVDIRVGERVAIGLRHALFEEGQDVTDPVVLASLARAHGLDPRSADEEAVRREYAEGQERGVIGSPHFFTARASFFCPALRIGHEADVWDIELDDEGLEAFTAAAFES